MTIVFYDGPGRSGTKGVGRQYSGVLGSSGGEGACAHTAVEAAAVAMLLSRMCFTAFPRPETCPVPRKRTSLAPFYRPRGRPANAQARTRPCDLNVRSAQKRLTINSMCFRCQRASDRVGRSPSLAPFVLLTASPSQPTAEHPPPPRPRALRPSLP